MTDRSWGHRPIWRWVGLGLGLLVVGWVGWFLWKSMWGDVGEVCDTNQDCRSRICLVEKGRLIQYCTVRCEYDEECPDDMKCIESPDLSYRKVCVRP